MRHTGERLGSRTEINGPLASRHRLVDPAELEQGVAPERMVRSQPALGDQRPGHLLGLGKTMQVVQGMPAQQLGVRARPEPRRHRLRHRLGQPVAARVLGASGLGDKGPAESLVVKFL